MIFELKLAGPREDGIHTGMAADHKTLASGLRYVGINPETGTLTIRFGQPELTDYYVYLDLEGAGDFLAKFNEMLEDLRAGPEIR